jgi:hypothetical protein
MGQTRQRLLNHHHFLQHLPGLTKVPCTDLVLPRPTRRRRAHFVTFHLPQHPPGKIVVAGTAIGPVKHHGENKCADIMAFCGGALKHVALRHNHTVVFHEDGTQPNAEAGLQVADAGQPGGELGTIVLVIVRLPGHTLQCMLRPTTGGVHTLHICATGCPQAVEIFHGIRCGRHDAANNVNS